MSVQKKKKKKKANKKDAIKVILMNDVNTEEEEGLDDEEESGIYLEKEDMLLIYNALKEYKPTEDEEVLHSTLFEEFEEILVVNYGVKLPGFEDFDEEEN